MGQAIRSGGVLISNGRFSVWESTSNLTDQHPVGDSVIYAFDLRHDN